MSTINDNFQVVAAAWEIDQRLTYHTQAGNMLDGLKYDKEATFKVDGEDSFPLLQPWAAHFEEDLWVGAPNPRSAGRAPANQPVQETLTLTYRVVTSRKNGWYRRDPTDPTVQKGYLEWLALIRDAIETPTGASPTPDSRFSSAAVKPVKFTISETRTSQLTFQGSLDVTIYVIPVCRAERSYTLPTP